MSFVLDIKEIPQLLPQSEEVARTRDRLSLKKVVTLSPCVRSSPPPPQSLGGRFFFTHIAQLYSIY